MSPTASGLGPPAPRPGTRGGRAPTPRPRSLRPGHEVLVDLTHELLITRIERLEERRLGAVPLVERQPLEVNPVGDGAGVELQGDLGPGAVSSRDGGTPSPAT